jgi:hypothetical protein
MVITTMIAVVTNEVGLRDGRLPQPRREGAEVVAVGHSRQAGENVPPDKSRRPRSAAAVQLDARDRSDAHRMVGIALGPIGQHG